MAANISSITARQILDSRGTPTVEVELTLSSGFRGRAAVPSGASTGRHEALELRDGGAAWGGKGVQRAVANVQTVIADAVVGSEFGSQAAFDEALCALDGSGDKSRLGANAILGASLAYAHAVASERELPLWQHVADIWNGDSSPALPVALLNILNGGAHANNGLDIQEFMVVPHGFASFSESLEAGVAVFRTLRELLASRGLSTAVGDEGGFAPTLGNNRDALTVVTEAIERAGYALGQQVSIALDVAASEFVGDDGRYSLRDLGEQPVSADELLAWYESLLNEFPIVSIEDAFGEDDWSAWTMATQRLGERVQLVGDDLFVTNEARVRTGIEREAANALLVKVNQVGTLTETLTAMRVAGDANMRCIMSHRSGETEDVTIADLAVGTACGQIKTGAPSRSERVAKYNQLLRIEEQLAGAATLARPWTAAVGA